MLTEKDEYGLSQKLLTKHISPLYQHFISNYKLGLKGIQKQKLFYDNHLMSLTSIGFFITIADKLYENSVYYFFSEEEILEELYKYLNNPLDYHLEGFILIGRFDIADSILLGIEGEHVNEIWSLNGDLGHERPEIQMISEDIFSFFRLCKEVIIEMSLKMRDINTSQLYRNWGEDFWRVREERD
ncbi:hypothetical protein P1X15_30865 [Runella sp. MFBS21]|uniref:hypothetical protein n=1 Tax=Runella sp. MFBS21 TaxID=3034018 RepID=UPI0023F71979|nr:hypothetical protein [Runella sp. MFBS21]MDF7822058.1 hypothetical protein [Runella sp. MFBS21]